MSRNRFKLDQAEKARSAVAAAAGEARRCRACGRRKRLSAFPGRVIRHLTYLQVSFLNTCRECRSERNAPAAAAVKRKDPTYARACAIWARSRRAGVKSDLRMADLRLLLTGPCYYCGRPCTELDMKDRSGGYVRANTLPSCGRCLEKRKDMAWAAWRGVIPTLRPAAT